MEVAAIVFLVVFVVGSAALECNAPGKPPVFQSGCSGEGSGWEGFGGKLIQIDTDGTTVIGVARRGQVYSKKGSVWQELPGVPSGVRHVSVGDRKILGISRRGNMYYRSGITSTNNVGTRWLKVNPVPCCLWQGDVGDGKLMGVSRDGKVYWRTGVSRNTPFGRGWKQLNGRLRHISIGNKQIVGTSDNSRIWYRANVNAQYPYGTGWPEMKNNGKHDGRMRQISLGGGRMVGVSSNGKVWYRMDMYKDVQPLGKYWKQMDGHLTYISTGGNMIWGVSARYSDHISNRKDVITPPTAERCDVKSMRIVPGGSNTYRTKYLGKTLLGASTGSTCTGSGTVNLQLSKSKTVSEEISIGVSTTDEVNWSNTVGIAVETGVKLLGSGTKVTVSYSHTRGGSYSFSKTKERAIGTEDSTTQGAENSFEKPGGGALIGTANHYERVGSHVPVKLDMYCSKTGRKFTKDATIQLKSQYYDDTSFHPMSGAYHKSACRDNNKRRAMRRCMLLFKQSLQDPPYDEYMIESRFRKCFKPEWGSILDPEKK